jgi:2-oxo-4-hydroxy-4-carboxy-5-ureidoimidazoline decarboxylase
MTIDQINQFSKSEFINAFSSIFEHSPWVADQAYSLKPFQSIEDLHQKMVDIVRGSGHDPQLKLICAHPELAGKAAVRKDLTHHSLNEQSGAGLDQCSSEEFELLQALNAKYLEKFGFPFILAVKGHNRQSIIQNFSNRLNNEIAVEFQECLEQIYRIAQFRLETYANT